nr:hypothetical protein [Candidatus Sigynarchaeota archaeon]
MMSAPKSQEPQPIADAKAFTMKCPTCKDQVTVSIPMTVKELGQGGLVNILIPDTQTKCGHAIQIFMDQNYKIRGYTRIDYVNREVELKGLGASQPEAPFFKEESGEEGTEAVSESQRHAREEMT